MAVEHFVICELGHLFGFCFFSELQVSTVISVFRISVASREKICSPFNYYSFIYFSTVSQLQYHFQPISTAPHAIFMQKDANGEHYLTSTTTHQNPLYVPPPPPPIPLSSSNSCQSSTTPSTAAPAAQQQFHLIRLQSNPPPTQNNELHSNNQTMHIKQQLHTATVHGKRRS